MENEIAMEMTGGMFAIIGQMILVIFIFALAMYVYMALAMMAMAKKTNTENGWMAWVPILNVYLMVKIAGKPGWWFVLFLIPIVNFVVAIILWMAMAERCGKPSWMGLLILVPIANLILPGILAWSGSAPAAPVQEGMPVQEMPSQPMADNQDMNQPQM